MNVFTCSVSDCFEIGSEVLYWIVWRKIKYRTDLDSLPDCFGETTCFFLLQIIKCYKAFFIVHSYGHTQAFRSGQIFKLFSQGLRRMLEAADCITVNACCRNYGT